MSDLFYTINSFVSLLRPRAEANAFAFRASLSPSGFHTDGIKAFVQETLQEEVQTMTPGSDTPVDEETGQGNHTFCIVT
jgi:hypothetical protein